MKTGFTAAALAGILLLGIGLRAGAGNPPKENVFEARPLGIRMCIKMVGPFMQGADL